ncbi:hypothetical protein ACFQ4L_01050 [Lapidilactobacillus mulanensis]|uniref:DUF2207 domain-containing protein n=1 Tax=Lapidilactobacillus mulanensis TaxID=2485999 RepID=A0ABW4DJ77_9LACO|nr:hypothetical protein [Lapidilactobacillus mulanensis]
MKIDYPFTNPGDSTQHMIHNADIRLKNLYAYNLVVKKEVDRVIRYHPLNADPQLEEAYLTKMGQQRYLLVARHGSWLTFKRTSEAYQVYLLLVHQQDVAVGDLVTQVTYFQVAPDLYGALLYVPTTQPTQMAVRNDPELLGQFHQVMRKYSLRQELIGLAGILLFFVLIILLQSNILNAGWFYSLLFIISGLLLILGGILIHAGYKNSLAVSTIPKLHQNFSSSLHYILTIKLVDPSALTDQAIMKKVVDVMQANQGAYRLLAQRNATYYFYVEPFTNGQEIESQMKRVFGEMAAISVISNRAFFIPA